MYGILSRDCFEPSQKPPGAAWNSYSISPLSSAPAQNQPLQHNFHLHPSSNLVLTEMELKAKTISNSNITIRFISITPDIKVDHNCTIAKYKQGLGDFYHIKTPHSCKAGLGE